MNKFEAFTRPVVNGHHAMIRLAHESKARPVLCKGGEPEVYPTELEAQRAATEHLCRYVNGKMRRDGETLLQCRRAADAHFKLPRLVKQRGRTKAVEVVRG